MSNIYDTFKSNQNIKNSSHDKMSANFISEPRISNIITHIRTNTTKTAVIVVNHKEGPDEVIVFSMKEDNLRKSDYFIYNNNYYLIYEDIIVTDANLPFVKQKAVECNVTFDIDKVTYHAYFVGSARRGADTLLEKSTIITSNERPLIIVSEEVPVTIGMTVVIGDKAWNVIESDDTTNKGVKYLSVEHGMMIQQAVVDVPVDNGNQEARLEPSMEYVFPTHNAYFVATPKVNVLERMSTSVKFVIPFGIPEVTIAIQDENNIIIENTYKVVF